MPGPCAGEVGASGLRLPLITRRAHEREVRDLRHRLFVLRDNMRQAAWRCSFNRSTPDTRAAERLLVMAMDRDNEKEHGTN